MPCLFTVLTNLSQHCAAAHRGPVGGFRDTECLGKKLMGYGIFKQDNRGYRTRYKPPELTGWGIFRPKLMGYSRILRPPLPPAKKYGLNTWFYISLITIYLNSACNPNKNSKPRNHKYKISCLGSFGFNFLLFFYR